MQMVGHGAKFGRKKEAAIAALLSQRSIEEAARSINVSPTTLHRWMKIPEFAEAFLEARRAVVSQTNARFQQSTGAAGAVVLKLMVDPSVPASVRLRAAECVLERAGKAIESEDILLRLSKLEQAAGVNDK